MNALKLKLVGVLLLIPVLAPIIYWGCETLPITPITRSETVVPLEGQVKDSRTDAPIEGVTVKIGDVATLTTDQDGMYRLGNAPEGVYTVTAEKEGYTMKCTEATVEENRATVAQMFLTQEGASEILDVNGGDVTDNFDGQDYRVELPAGALDTMIKISVTPIVGVELPAMQDSGQIGFATAHFGPDGLLLNDSAEIAMETALTLPAGVQVPVSYFNTTTNEWETMDELGTIGADGKTITTKINRLGTYSANFETEITPEPQGETEENTELSCDNTEFCITYRDDLTIQDNGGYSDVFITNLAEQEANTSFRHELNFCQSYSCASENQIGMSLWGVQPAYGNLRMCPRNFCTITCTLISFPTIYVYDAFGNPMPITIPISFLFCRRSDIVIFIPCHIQ